MVVNGGSEADQNIILNQCKTSRRFWMILIARHRSLHSSSLPNLASTLVHYIGVPYKGLEFPEEPFLRKYRSRAQNLRLLPQDSSAISNLKPKWCPLSTAKFVWNLWDPAFATSSRNLPSLPRTAASTARSIYIYIFIIHLFIYVFMYLFVYLLAYVGFKCDVSPCCMYVCVCAWNENLCVWEHLFQRTQNNFN